MPDEISKAKSLLRNAARPAVLAGAGLSAESGVPTFRGEDGLWRNFRPEELASPEAFTRDPKLVWEWYDWRRQVISDLKPNPGHTALADLEKSHSSFWLITQNVDGLSRSAGSRKVLEIHGNIWRVKCTGCGKYFEDRSAHLTELPPTCRDCGKHLRPDIVWFGESLPSGTLNKALDAARNADLFLIIGTAGVVEPAASLARLSKEAGAKIIEINLEKSALSEISDILILGKSGEILPKLVY
jgi:NAD-dependent deacetylase